MSPFLLPTKRPEPPRHVGRVLLALSALLLSVWAGRELLGLGEARPKDVVLALEAAEVRRLTRSRGYSFSDFLERAKTMGVSALELPDGSLRDRVERGEAHFFGNAEVRKWKALEIVLDDAPLEGNSVWSRSEARSRAIERAAAEIGVPSVRGSAAGHEVLRFPERLDPLELRLGPDPGILGVAEKHGLFPVFDPRGRDRFSDPARRRIADPKTLFAAVRYRRGHSSREALLRLLQEKDRWLILEEDDLEVFPHSLWPLMPAGTMVSSDLEVVPEKEGSATGVPSGVRRSKVRYLRLRLSMDDDIEGNLDWIRAAAQALRAEGFRLSFPFPERDRSRRWGSVPLPDPNRRSVGFLTVRLAVAVFLLLLLPYGTLRLSLFAARSGKRGSLGAAVGTALSALVLGGFWIYAVMSPSLFRLGLGPAPSLAPAAVTGFFLGLLFLYGDLLIDRRRWIRASATHGDLIQWAVLLAAGFFFWDPTRVLGEAFSQWNLWGAQWLPRSAWLGFPALALGLVLYVRRIRKSETPSSLARFLFLLGLVVPAEVGHAFSRPWVPFLENCKDLAFSAGWGLLVIFPIAFFLVWED